MHQINITTVVITAEVIMSKYQLPVNYEELSAKQRREVRLRYIEEQNNKCSYCGGSLDEDPPERITDIYIDFSYFPPGFLKHPVHLQHNHDTGMTEGAVHAYCNAVLWQKEGR